MRVRLVSLAVLLCALVATRAGAEELLLGAAVEGTYNSNFFSSATNEESAISFQVGPIAELWDRDGRFRYDLLYTGGYQAYTNQDGVNAWESRARGRVSYQIDRLTRVRLIDRFSDVSNLRFSRDDIADAATALNPNQARYLRNDLELEVTRVLARRLGLTVIAGHHWIDWKDNFDRNDSQAFDVSGEVGYQLATEHSLGIGAEYVYQNYDSAVTRLGSTANYISAFLTWGWAIASNIQVNARGGPVWVHSSEDDTTQVSQDRFVGGERGGQIYRATLGSCSGISESGGVPVSSTCQFDGSEIPAADLGGVQDFTILGGERVGEAYRVTFFGGASARVDLDEWSLLALYARRQSTTSGEALASSLDRVELQVDFAPWQSRWSVFGAGAFDRRQTLTDATVIDYTLVPGAGTDPAERSQAFTYIDNRDSRRDNYTAIVGARAALTPRQSLTLEFRYRHTEARSRGRTAPGVNTYFVVLTAEYVREAFRF